MKPLFNYMPSYQPTILEHFFPVVKTKTAQMLWHGKTRGVVLCIAFSFLMALSAQLQIILPFTPVPISAQTLVVLLSGVLLGPQLGFAAMALYLIEGAMGLPVFAGVKGGAMVLVGPTAGYLWTFPLAAGLTGWLTRCGWDRKWWSCAAAMLIGNVVIYSGGLLVLSVWLNLGAASVSDAMGKAFHLGMLPFLIGDGLKIGLAMILLPSAWRLSAHFGKNKPASKKP